MKKTFKVEMMNQNEKNKQLDLWRGILYSSDVEAIKNLIEILHDEGNVEILPDILNVYKAYKGKEIGDIIFGFLLELKKQESSKIIMKYIENVEYNSIKTELVSLCWQTSLDFSEYFDDFVDIFINSDIKTAFEAFTVIEYLNYVDSRKIELVIKKLQMNIDQISDEKKELFVDLVNILRTKIKN